MGNEMGNANVSGLQEVKNGENEAENKSLETHITDGNDNSIIAQKQSDSAPKDENYHDYVDLSGLDKPGGDEEMSAKIGSDDREQKSPDRFLNDLLISKGSNDEEKEPLSTRKEETSESTEVVSDITPPQTGGSAVEDRKEKETTDSKIQLASNATTEEGARSVISSDDGNYHEMESASDKSLPETSDDKIQRSSKTEGEESTTDPEIRLHLLISEGNAINDQDSDQLKPNLINNELYDGVVQRSNSEDQVLSILLEHNDNKGKEPEKEKVTEHMLDGSACASSVENSEVESLGNSMQVEVENSQEEKVLLMNQTNDLRMEIKAGAGVGEALDNEDVENGEEQQFKISDFDKKDSTHSHLEVAPVSTSLELLHKENFQAEDKFIVLTNDENLSKGPQFEEKKNILNVISPSQESLEEPKLGKMNTSNFDGEATETSEVNKYTIRADLQTTEEKAIGVGHHFAFQDISMSSVREEDMYSGQEPETRDKNSGPPIELWAVDTNSEDVKFSKCSLPLRGSHVEEPVSEKGELQYEEETVAPKAVSFNLDPTKPDTSFPLPPVENQSQNPKSILPAMEIGPPENWSNKILELTQERYEEVDVSKTSNLHAEVSIIEASMKRKTRGISEALSQGQEHIYPSDPPIGYDSKMNLGSPDSNESYTTAYEQEHLLPNVDAAVESSFRVDDQVAQNLFVEMIADFDRHDEFSREGEAEFSKQTSLKYEEKAISSEMFKASDSELYAHKVGVSVASPLSETTILAPQDDKDIPSGKPSQEQISEDNQQVTTLGRTNSAKLDIHIPFLSYLKDDTYYRGSQHKQEKLVTKKTLEEKWNTRENKNSDTARQTGAKRKVKPLFFNICMCCAPDIP